MMEIVIKISQESYNNLKIGCTQRVSGGEMIEAIKGGKPLPKGHGDLKDADKLRDAFIKLYMAVQGNYTFADLASIVCNSPTIIKADKEGEQ